MNTYDQYLAEERKAFIDGALGSMDASDLPVNVGFLLGFVEAVECGTCQEARRLWRGFAEIKNMSRDEIADCETSGHSCGVYQGNEYLDWLRSDAAKAQGGNHNAFPKGRWT